VSDAFSNSMHGYVGDAGAQGHDLQLADRHPDGY
jgi:hypothetical protein